MVTPKVNNVINLNTFGTKPICDDHGKVWVSKNGLIKTEQLFNSWKDYHAATTPNH